MANGSNGFGQRVLLGLLPIAISALCAHALYVLVWGVKIDQHVARIEHDMTDLRARVVALEQQSNSTQSQLDTLVALLRRERADKRERD